MTYLTAPNGRLETRNDRRSREAWEERRSFRQSAFSGTPHFSGWGDLPSDCRPDPDSVAYWFYSYRTPIAWLGTDGTPHVVPRRWSLTTSQHTAHAAQLLGVSAYGSSGRAVPPNSYGNRTGW
jgi:hypothetical protein